MPPASGCPNTGPPSPEVTEAICRVPSASFSQAPWYTLPVHLCRFGVRSYGGAISWKPFTAHTNPIRMYNLLSPSLSSWFRNINLIPIGYAFQPHLRGRLNLRRLALRRNPWTFGGSVFRTPVVTHVCIRASDTSRRPHRSSFTGLRNAPLPLFRARSFGVWL